MADETSDEPKVTIHEKKWVLDVEATFEDAGGARRNHLRLELPLDATDDDVKAEIIRMYRG